jgi:hypothetical protein
MCVSFETTACCRRTELTPSSDADVWHGVADAFDAAIDTPTTEVMFALRVATTESAGKARRQGLSPERAVVALKTLLARHGGCGWAPSLDADPAVTQAETRVYTKLFGWFVSAFYDD